MNLLTHAIFLGLIAGLAYGANAEHMRPLICFGLSGAAIATAITFVFRLIIQ